MHLRLFADRFFVEKYFLMTLEMLALTFNVVNSMYVYVLPFSFPLALNRRRRIDENKRITASAVVLLANKNLGLANLS